MTSFFEGKPRRNYLKQNLKKSVSKWAFLWTLVSQLSKLTPSCPESVQQYWLVPGICITIAYVKLWLMQKNGLVLQ